MSTRAYYRDSHGRFAGSGGGHVTFGKAGGFSKGHSFVRSAQSAVRSRANAAGGLARKLGAKTVGREYYVQTSYIKTGRRAQVALLSRRLTVRDQMERSAAKRFAQRSVTYALGAQRGHIAGAGAVRRTKINQRAANPGKVIKAFSVGLPGGKKLKGKK